MLSGLSESASNAASVLLIVGALSVGLVSLHLRAPALEARLVRLVTARSFWGPACFALLAGFGALLALNVSYPGYLDQAEPSIASVSWMLLKGAPLYHAFDSAARYSLLYGPASYLPYAAGLALAGAKAAALKGVVFLANAMMLFFLWRAFRTQLAALPALLVTVLVLLFLLVPRPNDYLFQVRADVVLLAAIAVALFGASQPSGAAGPVALALAAAFVIDTKATGFVYLLPLFATFYRLRGLRLSLLVAVAATAIAGLPFLLPNVSVLHYVAWVQRGTGHPRALRDLLSTLRTLPILALPVLLLLGPTPWRNPRFGAYLRARGLNLLALGLTLAFAILASTRIGAGSHHLLPVLPVLAYECTVLYRALDGGDLSQRYPFAFRSLAACSAVVVLFRVGGGLLQVLNPWFDWSHAVSVRDEVRGLVREYGPEVAIGYGDRPDYSTFFRPETVFAGSHVLVDEIALSDMEMDGIPLPSATIDALDACAVKAWLIPKNEEPFSMRNTFAEFYPDLAGSRPLFSPAYRATFANRYVKKASSQSFDVWTCNPPSELRQARE